VFGLGCGLVQIQDALQKFGASNPDLYGFTVNVGNQGTHASVSVLIAVHYPPSHFRVCVSGVTSSGTDRGVYWRDASKSSTATRVRGWSVTDETVFVGVGHLMSVCRCVRRFKSVCSHCFARKNTKRWPSRTRRGITTWRWRLRCALVWSGTLLA
jgi:hypothetical protein